MPAEVKWTVKWTSYGKKFKSCIEPHVRTSAPHIVETAVIVFETRIRVLAREIII